MSALEQIVGAKPLFVALNDPGVRLYGLDARKRAEQVAGKAGLEVAVAPRSGRSVILADLRFACDPAWLGELKQRPDSVLVLDGRPVLAHVAAADRERMAAAMTGSEPFTADGLDVLDARTAGLNYHELRKRERPFVMPIPPGNVRQVERALYDASYKGVTDALTLYLWRRPAFHLTRWAAQAGLSPNMVTLIGFVFCAAAFWLFWEGQYWWGIASGLVFMVLDTVDGKLARCTGTSSRWGDILDHGVDLVHPPFWWWAWVHGLEAAGHGLEQVYALMILGAIIAGYVLQRVIEGLFIARFGMHIHVWRPVDSRFRLITARRNPNMVILFVSVLFGRPDIGIELVALWTMLSLIFHAVRLAQATARADRGRKIISWLS